MRGLLKKLNTGVETVLDLIFPPREAYRVVQHLDTQELHALLIVQHIHGVVALMRYEDSRVRALIHEAKFHMNMRAWKLLGDMCASYLKKHGLHERVLLVPIPLSRERLRRRGYNQVEQVLREVQTQLPGLKLETDLLTRTRETRPQTELARAERLKNVAHAFKVSNPETVHGAHIILVDDVTTTGATLHAAKASLLLHAPASITCIALAH